MPDKPLTVVRIELGIRIAALDEEGEIIDHDIIGTDLGYMRILRGGPPDKRTLTLLRKKIQEVLIGVVGANDLLLTRNDFVRIPIDMFEPIMGDVLQDDDGNVQKEIVIGALERKGDGVVAKIIPPDGKIH